MINPEGTEEQNTSTAGQEWQTMANEVLAKNANESHEAAPVRVDLVTPEYDEKFRNAELYVKKAEVQAEPVTQEGLESGAYANMGVKYDAEQGKYYIETIVMRNKRNADGTVTRYAATENPHDVEPGQWLVTNPIIKPGDAPNIYPVEEGKVKGDGDKAKATRASLRTKLVVQLPSELHGAKIKMAMNSATSAPSAKMTPKKAFRQITVMSSAKTMPPSMSQLAKLKPKPNQ